MFNKERYIELLNIYLQENVIEFIDDKFKTKVFKGDYALSTYEKISSMIFWARLHFVMTGTDHIIIIDKNTIELTSTKTKNHIQVEFKQHKHLYIPYYVWNIKTKQQKYTSYDLLLR